MKTEDLFNNKRTIMMGVLNVTPNSFSDGGLYLDTNKAVEHAKQMIKDGADIIDIGGESSKPGSDPISEEEELKRVTPIIKKLKETGVLISIDTYKPRVAEECLKLGAHIVNDITGLRNKEMTNIISKYDVPVIIMHMLGTPKTMQDNIQYSNVINDIREFFQKRISEAKQASINKIILDPGIGFGKTTEHNLQILKHLDQFDFNYPILIGPSRKSFIGNITNLPVDQRLEGTIASISIGILNRANIIRIHDIKECKRAALIADAVKNTN